MSSNPKTARDPKDYVMKQQPAPVTDGQGTPGQPAGGSIAKPNAPITTGAVQ